MDSKFFENEVSVMASSNLGFQHFRKNEFFAENASTSVAKFTIYKKNLNAYVIPKDPQQRQLFCRVVDGKHTAKLKDDGCTVTIRFDMVGILSSEKIEGKEVLTIAPVEGSEELFNSSQLIRTSADGKMERQIAFECDIKCVSRVDVCQYLDNDGPSDR